MTIEAPIWLQAGTYPARLDRSFIEQVLHGAERVFNGLAVSGTGSTTTITVSAGSAAIAGDTELNQGMYFVRSTGEETVTLPAASGVETNYVIMRIEDSTVDGGGVDAASFEVVADASSIDSHIVLATIERNGGDPIFQVAVTDVRPLGAYPYGVGTEAPPTVGVEGDLYIQLAL